MMKELMQITNMLYINLSIVLSAVLTITIAILVYALKCNRQRRAYLMAFESLINKYEEIDGKNKKKLSAYKNIFNIALIRAYSSLSTYFRYQVVTKVFGVTSCIFSAIVFIEPTNISEQIGNRLVAIISMICVMTVIYLNPLDRARDYLSAWRMWIEYVSEIISGFSISINDGEDKLLEISEKIKQENEILNADKT